MNHIDTLREPPRGPLRGARDIAVPLERLTTRDQSTAIMDYLSLARRRKWLILGSIAAFLLLGLVITLLMTPQYRASTTIEIQRETGNFTMVKGAQPDDAGTIDQEFYETQYGLLQADSVAERVATQLKLTEDAKFFEMFKSKPARLWFQNGRLAVGVSSREQRTHEAGDILLKHFYVSPVRLSRLVDITFTSPDAQFSRKVADAWAAVFIQMTLERRYEATSYARKFLEGRLTQLRGRIDESERQLVNYASREGIVNLPSSTPAGEGGVTGERSIVADDLAALNRELSRATAERVQAESRLAAGGAVTEALENTAISSLRERRADLAADYAKLLVQFEPGYPQAQALQTQIAQLDRSIAREEGRVAQTLRETYQANVEREGDLRARVSALKGDVLDLRRRSIQYNIFQRDADTNRQLYEALLQRYKEIGVAGGVGVNNISIVDVAQLPQKPSSPRFAVNMLVALLAGLAVGVGLAFAVEQIDEGIGDPAEIEKELGVPLLGTIPKVTEGTPLDALQDRKSSVAEAYLSLQTNLSFSTDHGVPRSIAITSSRPAEGKSTTSYALARSLARSSRRTLLIDADMRSPSMHHLFGVENTRGLSNFLAGDDAIDASILPTANDNLFLMTAGPQPPSAAELLSSDRVALLLRTLLDRFDHVVLDAPPVMGLADAPLIGSSVEGVVFVMESHATKKSMVRVALDRLDNANAQILGAALTKFDTKRAFYGYGYDYGYGYGYGNNTAPET